MAFTTFRTALIGCQPLPFSAILASTDMLIDSRSQKKVSKREIAHRQLNYAIYLYMTDCDPVSVFTIVSPSSQILRDINKTNSGTLSSVMTQLIKENVKNPNILWKEFNADAARFKHGRDLKETVNLEEIQRILPGEIMFCVCEWMLLPENRPTLSRKSLLVGPYMHTFVNYYFRAEKRVKNGKNFCRITNYLDRQSNIRLTHYKIKFLTALHSLLLRLKIRME